MKLINKIIKYLNYCNDITNTNIIFKLNIDKNNNIYEYLVIDTIGISFGEKPKKTTFNSKKALQKHLKVIEKLYIKTFNK